jgi:hypothetical protein
MTNMHRTLGTYDCINKNSACEWQTQSICLAFFLNNNINIPKYRKKKLLCWKGNDVWIFYFNRSVFSGICMYPSVHDHSINSLLFKREWKYPPPPPPLNHTIAVWHIRNPLVWITNIITLIWCDTYVIVREML